MKENTFDVPAYKFLAVKINDGIESHTYDEYENCIQAYNNSKENSIACIYIPFENIDGLETEEVRHLLGTKEIMIVVATSYNNDNYNDNNNKIDIRTLLYLPEEFLDDKKPERIDKVIEKSMSEEYMEYVDFHKKVARCFFERYQDGSYRKTKKRIRKLERKRNI